jgi:hypothetical protein
MCTDASGKQVERPVCFRRAFAAPPAREMAGTSNWSGYMKMQVIELATAVMSDDEYKGKYSDAERERVAHVVELTLRKVALIGSVETVELVSSNGATLRLRTVTDKIGMAAKVQS